MNFLKSFMRTMVLIWADILAVYAMWMMMTYLTNVWKLNFTHAAAIVNVFWGLVMMMPIGMQFLVDTIMGNYWMLLLSSIAYSTGLGLLSMSTPSVLPDTSSCSAYKSECIGDSQRILFYTALGFTAVGMSGHVTSLNSFAAEQMIVLEGEENRRGRIVGMCMGSFAIVLVPIAGAIAIPYIKPWSVRFGIPAICTVTVTFIFLTGSCSYNYVGPQGSPLTAVVRVFVAAASKMCHRCPSNANQLYERQNSGLQLLSHTRGLRYLDKAAIILPNKTLQQQERNRWRLCRVTEVEETKILIRMIPMCMTFIICGVVSSIGTTYFIEQANHMNPKVGELKVPIPILLWFYDQAKTQFGNVYFQIAKALGGSGSKRYAPPIGIAVSMIFAVLCCITAAKVETRRLDVIRSHGLLDKPEERIPMSIFWLLPQYLLLGALDGIYGKSITCFIKDQSPSLLSRYMQHICLGLFGVGIMGCVLSVDIVGKISERGGKPNWFQDTLNKSRLDNYYWTLAAMSAVNLVLYVLVAFRYAYKESESNNMEAQQFDETAEPYDDNPERCCC